MAINVKFFASLRESLGREQDTLDSDTILTVADVWKRVSGNETPPPNLLTAINMEYVKFDHPVRDGDEVAFFPPVTGG